MVLYNYKGYDAQSGNSKKGTVDAETPRAARAKLRREKIIISKLEEASAPSKQQSSLFARRVSLLDLAVMTRQFATLQNAQVPLDESLAALTSQVDNPELRNVMAGVRDDISEGKPLATALLAYPKVFNRLYVNMVEAGESSGKMGLVLERLADYIEYQVEIKGKIFSALSYPAIMIAASLAIIAYLFISVVPGLQKVFNSLKVTLPWYTEKLITFSEFLQAHWVMIIIATGVLTFLLRQWSKSTAGGRRVDLWALTLPILGSLVVRINVSKFTKTLSTLLNSGVPIIAALEITKNTIANSVIADILEDAKTSVQEGDSLGNCIERSSHFPPLVTHMIRTGEKTGDLEGMLSHVAQAYDSEVERKIAALIALIEPLMIIVMACVASVVIIALLVPMLSVMSSVR
ncbi:MAG: type II secretion system inner membrane protein GspF [Pseudomonadota bacterium]|nr:type II secretion system inner membrane protein GspF [Pseudomonadota bacterium]